MAVAVSTTKNISYLQVHGTGTVDSSSSERHQRIYLSYIKVYILYLGTTSTLSIYHILRYTNYI